MLPPRMSDSAILKSRALACRTGEAVEHAHTLVAHARYLCSLCRRARIREAEKALIRSR